VRQLRRCGLPTQTKMSGLTFREEELWRAFQAYLNLNKKESFTVDDLLTYFTEERLRQVFKDPIHEKGAFFSKLLRLGEIEEVGETYGRYNRRIRLYQQT